MHIQTYLHIYIFIFQHSNKLPNALAYVPALSPLSSLSLYHTQRSLYLVLLSFN